ncbi:MAG: HU family DNA-binding protein [Clostridiales bacterium]|nr:HU family DNA-binding protein [Clostridiales bacterium]
MNKAQLVSKMAEKCELTKKDTETALNAFMGSVQETLVEGEKIQLVGFGTFEVRERKPRKGRNPRNPEQVIDIPASKAPVFKAGKTLKEKVNV